MSLLVIPLIALVGLPDAPVRIDAETVHLRSVPVIAPDARIIRMTSGGEVPASSGPTVSVLADGHGSLIFVTPSGAASGIRIGSDTLHTLEVDWASRTARTGIAIEPSVPAGAALPCGLDTGTLHVPPDGTATTRGMSPAAGPRVASLAVDIDRAYLDRFNGDETAALNAVTATIASVSAIFERDIDLRLQITQARIWSTGGEPWGDPPVLSQFRSWWLEHDDAGQFRFVHLISGHRNTPFGGIAYLATACDDGAFAISAFLAGNAAPPDAAPSLEWWDTNVIAHEMGHNLGTAHTHDGYDPVIDDCGNSVSAPRGTIMSYCHLHPGGMLNIDLRLHRRVQDLITQLNPLDDCLFFDCNANGVDDAVDIARETSLDDDSDGIPDECRDCNGNGVLDTIDLLDPTASDVDGNLVPDECQPDCDANGLPDAWEIDEYGVPDADGDNVPDACETDCDANGVFDFVDIQSDHALDLDRNGVLDACEDCDGDPTPDWLTAGGSGNIIVAGDGVVGEYLAASGVRLFTYGEDLFDDPAEVTLSTDGALWACDPTTGMVARFSLGASMPDLTIDTGGSPRGLLVTDDARLLVLDGAVSEIQQYEAATGASLGTLVPSGPNGLFNPKDMIQDGGRLLVTTHDTQVRAFDASSGAYLGMLINDIYSAGGDSLCVLPGGDIVVASPFRETVRRYSGEDGSSSGDFLDEYTLSTPTDVVPLRQGQFLVPRANPGGYARIVQYDENRTYLRSLVRGYPDMLTPMSIVVRPPGPLDCDGNGRPDVCDLADGGDQDGDGELDACQCIGDIDGDGQVGVEEILTVIEHWGSAGSPADVDGSGVVDTGDVLLILSHWGAC